MFTIYISKLEEIISITETASQPFGSPILKAVVELQTLMVPHFDDMLKLVDDLPELCKKSKKKIMINAKIGKMTMKLYSLEPWKSLGINKEQLGLIQNQLWSVWGTAQDALHGVHLKKIELVCTEAIDRLEQNPTFEYDLFLL